MGVRAIDVSRHQGTIDWHAVARDGVQAVWVKVGGADGGLYKDSRADTNLTGVDAAGLPYGTYYFCDTRSGAVEQARHAVACGHGRGLLWPAADLETNAGGLSQGQIDVWLATFCAEVRRLTGRDSIWYGNRNVGVGYTSSAPPCPLWIANYGQNTPGTTPPGFQPALPLRYSGWDIWQFNSVTRVAGIPDNTVDQNVITDAFWARMTTGAPAAPADPEEDLVKRPVICPDAPPAGSGDAQWMLTFDGDGRPRRLFLAGGDPELYWGLGQLTSTDPIAYTGEAAARFLAIPEAAPSTALDPAAVIDGLRQPLVDTVTAVLAAQHLDVDEHAVAEAVVAELGTRLAS